MELQENARLGLKQCVSMATENDKSKEALKKVLLRQQAFFHLNSLGSENSSETSFVA